MTAKGDVVAKKVKVESVWEDVTPDTASQYLLLNKTNRPKKHTRIAEWAKKMTDGDWSVTHQGIGFDWDGNLIDGQNRLEAIVMSGKTIRVLVTYNLDPATFTDIDDGIARSGADLFAVRYQRKHGEMPRWVNAVTSVAYAMLTGLEAAATTKDDSSEYALKHYALICEFSGIWAKPIAGTPVAGAFANAALFFGLGTVLPLALRFQSEMWDGLGDPLKVLHARLLRAKLREQKRDILAKQEKYAVTVAAIRNALAGASHGKLVVAMKDFGTPDDKKLKAKVSA